MDPILRLLKKAQRRAHRAALRDYYAAVLSAACICLILRLLHIGAAFYSPVSDMDAYALMSRRILNPDVPVQIGTTLFPPGYALFLKLFPGISAGTGFKSVLVIQALADFLATFSIAFVGRYLFAPVTGVIAAFAFAFYKLSILNTGLLMTEALSTALILFSTALFFLFLRRPSWARATACAITMAALFHLRSNCVPLAFVFGLYSVYTLRKYRSSTWGYQVWLLRPAFLVFISLILLVPWSVRNTRITGRPTFIADNLPPNLFIGNNPYANGGWISSLPPEEMAPFKGKANVELHEAYRDYAKRFIRENPSYEIFYLVPERIARLFFKELQFWPWQNESEGGFWEHPFGPHLFVLLLGFYPVLTLGLIGFALPQRRLPYFLPAVWIALLLPLALLFTLQRFRTITDPLLIIAGAEVIRRVTVNVPFRRFLRYALGIVVLCSLAGTGMNILRFSGPDLVQTTASGEAALKSMVTDSGFHLTPEDLPKSLPFTVPLGSIPVNPGLQSHLLFRFLYDITPVGPPSRPVINFKLTYLDQNGKPIRTPYASPELFPRNLEPGRWRSRDLAWRIVRLPQRASRVNLELIVGHPAAIKLSDFQIRGPVWTPSTGKAADQPVPGVSRPDGPSI